MPRSIGFGRRWLPATGITETLVNYRPDGSSWWNQLTITPVRDHAQELTHFVGVQSNADARMLADRQRDDARTAASDAEGRLYATEHSLALALQRSLLPVLPEVPGLDLAARYIPASDSAEIGGDWYDVLPLPDGATGIAIGAGLLRVGGSTGRPRCWSGSTNSSAVSAWRSWQPASTPVSNQHDEAGRWDCDGRTPDTHRRCCAHPTGA